MIPLPLLLLLLLKRLSPCRTNECHWILLNAVCTTTKHLCVCGTHFIRDTKQNKKRSNHKNLCAIFGNGFSCAAAAAAAAIDVMVFGFCYLFFFSRSLVFLIWLTTQKLTKTSTTTAIRTCVHACQTLFYMLCVSNLFSESFRDDKNSHNTFRRVCVWVRALSIKRIKIGKTSFHFW